MTSFITLVRAEPRSLMSLINLRVDLLCAVFDPRLIRLYLRAQCYDDAVVVTMIGMIHL